MKTESVFAPFFVCQKIAHFSIRDSYQIHISILSDSHEKILKLPNGKKKDLKLTFVLS